MLFIETADVLAWKEEKYHKKPFYSMANKYIVPLKNVNACVKTAVVGE